MIYKRMSGRLGNQMFQYAAVRNYQLKYRPEEEIVLDFSDVYKLGKKEDGFINSLKEFNLPNNVKFVDNYKIDFIPNFLFHFYKMLCMFLKITDFSKKYKTKRKKLEDIFFNFFARFGLIIYTDGYREFPNIKRKNLYFFGFYESIEFFKESKNQLINEFKPKEKIKNNKLINEIRNSNSICVSVRAGDFLSSKFINEYYVCKPIYFEQAITKISDIIPNPKIFIFSDDIDWVKNNINLDNRFEYIYEKSGLSVYEKLYYMSNCKHFIISNSSFSFWAQFLSNNSDKIVIAPSKWNARNEKVDIYEKNWIILKV